MRRASCPQGGRRRLDGEVEGAGEICVAGEGIDLDACCLVAEVYGNAFSPETEAIAGSYFLAHGLSEARAERAMEFFASQPSLIVAVNRIVDDCGSPMPARVVIRYTDQARDYLATVYEFGVLRELPEDGVVSEAGWDLFATFDALSRGVPAAEAQPLPSYDYRSLRRKVVANRAGIDEDRNPWLQGELDRLRELTRDEPEGFEALAARADDIEAVLAGRVTVDEAFSIIIPTAAERQVQKGAIADWVKQAGREIVVAHGLDAVQAARALRLVREDPEAYVSKDRLLKGTGRETLLPPIVIADTSLNWIATDFSGRRATAAYEQLRQRINEVGSQPASPTTERGAGR